MKKIGIIGCGSFGLALAKHLIENGNEVKVWSYSEETKDALNNNHVCKNLKGVVFPEKLKAYTDFYEVVYDAEYIIHVTPSKFFRETLNKYKKYITKDKKIIICSKGFENVTTKTLEEVLEEEVPNIKYGVLTGPSHAEEVSKDIQTAIVIASKDDEILNDVVNMFNQDKVRIYKSNDVIGVALGGGFKNIIAFCAGVVVGLGAGDNTLAALITRGLAELAKLSEKMGANPTTIYGLTGLGDLIVTCMSQHSRNRRAGILLSQGKNIEEIQTEIGMVVEAIDNIEVAHNLAKKYDVEMPIVNAIYMLLKGKTTADEAISNLMKRKNKFE